jgi:hypothetical protein
MVKLVARNSWWNTISDNSILVLNGKTAKVFYKQIPLAYIVKEYIQ